MRLTAISDLHGEEPELPGGDILIIAGDVTARDEVEQWERFCEWMLKQKYDKKIFISGNHDRQSVTQFDYGDAEYLMNSGCEFRGYKIWGCPYTKSFYGMNPACMAYTKKTDEELKEYWDLIPDNIDIIVTHGPAYGVLDHSKRAKRYGSESLRKRIVHLLKDRVKPLYHICGHIHEGHGKAVSKYGTSCCYHYNVSLLDEDYIATNSPTEINLP